MNVEGNRGGSVAVPVRTRTIGEHLADFDRLPWAHRRLVREAAYDIDTAGLGTCSLPALRQALAMIQAQSVLATYGPEHPEAARR